MKAKIVSLKESAAEYQPATSSQERAAYLAAHRILSRDLSFPQYVTPGRRHAARVDQIAEIILEEFTK